MRPDKLDNPSRATLEQWKRIESFTTDKQAQRERVERIAMRAAAAEAMRIKRQRNEELAQIKRLRETIRWKTRHLDIR